MERKYLMTLRDVRTLDQVLKCNPRRDEKVLLDIVDDIAVNEYCNISLFVDQNNDRFEIVDDDRMLAIMLRRATEKEKMQKQVTSKAEEKMQQMEVRSKKVGDKEQQRKAFINQVDRLGVDMEELNLKITELKQRCERLRQRQERGWKECELKQRRLQQQMERVDRYLARVRLEEGSTGVAEEVEVD